MKHPIPKVGDTVVLNDYGLRVCFGSDVGLSHMKTKRMRITHVGSVSLTRPEETLEVGVDDPEIDQFMIHHHCVDIVERAK